MKLDALPLDWRAGNSVYLHRVVLKKPVALQWQFRAGLLFFSLFLFQTKIRSDVPGVEFGVGICRTPSPPRLLAGRFSLFSLFWEPDLLKTQLLGKQ